MKISRQMNCDIKERIKMKKPEDGTSYQQKVKERKTLKEILHEFAHNTTAHGFGQVLATSNIFVKCFWITIMIVCAAALCIQINPLINRFFSKPTSTKISIVTRGGSRILFNVGSYKVPKKMSPTMVGRQRKFFVLDRLKWP